MKPNLSHLDAFRSPADDERGSAEGMFRFPLNDGDITLQVIATELGGFDRVSVVAFEKRPLCRKGYRTREPSLRELRYVRRMFFDDSETVFLSLAPEGNVKSKAVQFFRAQDVPMPEFG